jgi:hypothetical protein
VLPRGSQKWENREERTAEGLGFVRERKPLWYGSLTGSLLVFWLNSQHRCVILSV